MKCTLGPLGSASTVYASKSKFNAFYQDGPAQMMSIRPPKLRKRTRARVSVASGQEVALPPFQPEAHFFVQLTTGEADSLAKTSALHCRAAATVGGKTS
eukprot:s1820_g15.t1